MRTVVQVTKKSPFTGKENTMSIVLDLNDLRNWESRNLLIQEALPYLTPEEREFIMTGYTPEDWKAIFPPEAQA